MTLAGIALGYRVLQAEYWLSRLPQDEDFQREFERRIWQLHECRDVEVMA